MSLSTDDHIEIDKGFETCPSCKSDSWKSAKMIVMEGTSTTEGAIKGTSTDPGALSGGLHELLLSDRWFSWAHNIELDVGLITKSGLVDEVQRLMVANSSLVKMPPIPAIPNKPEKIGFFGKIRPVSPTLPIKPERPVSPESEKWTVHFMKSMNVIKWFAIVIAIIVTVFDKSLMGLLVGASLFVLSVPINLIRSFWGDKRAKERYKNDIYIFREQINSYESALLIYEEKYQLYKLECHSAELQKTKEEASLVLYKQSLALYFKELSDYEVKRNNVMKARELLWERAHVCLRCGTGYLGKPQDVLVPI